MLAKIKKELREGFERNLFDAAQKNLSDKSNPLRLNNYSYAMRELTRHFLHRLAPDDNVLTCAWYRNETGKENGISRRQRAIYAVQGGLPDSYVKNSLGLQVKDIHKRLVKSINKLSKFTHIETNVFDLPDSDVDALVWETTESVSGFFTAIIECRKEITDSLWELIDSTVIDEVLRETILEIDELATHHFIEEIYNDKIELYEINHEAIKFRAEGTIACELQWGSNSDQRRGDGGVTPQSFPFTCELFSPICDLETIEVEEGTFGVDTSSWTNVRYGQDEMA